MTHDEIAQMGADALNAAIDTLKGITHGEEIGTLLGFPVAYIPKKWATNIAAAWELGEEFPEWSAGKYPSGYRFIGWDYRDGELYKAAEEYGQSIEIAICRAYLMWKQG